MRCALFLTLVANILVSGCAREPVPPSTPAERAPTTPSTPAQGEAKMDEIRQTIKLTGFDPEGEPVIRVMADGSLLIVFNFMPPSFVPEEQQTGDSGLGPFADFDKQLQRAAGVPVVWDDREVFVVQKPKKDTVERICKFLENYRRK
jgi:hypothetical protein